MAVVLTKDSRIVVQGATGYQGQFHIGQMKQFGTNVVAGVTPGKGGEAVHGVPVFDTVAEAVQRTQANTSLVFVPAPFAKDAVLEAVDAGCKVVIVITEHIPVHDSAVFVNYAKAKGVTLIGPNCPGACSPGANSKVGILPGTIFKPGPVAVASKSGTLTYEIVAALSEAGIGQSACLGLGGDPVPGTTLLDAVKLFENDPDTKAIVLVGEIGGGHEEEAAEYIQRTGLAKRKPVYAYVAGRTAPEGKKMGHAGALVEKGKGTAESKLKAFAAAGVKVATFPTDIAGFVKADLKL
ncbi:MAG: succinyl-CoA synthetase alpha subunit [Thermoplasmata archaeon]|jgi:succinyl-CoA synthetase alpha subunit|nr:succinyl-CoA synthetase alpha subunit [Thermoplasmata archaeon]HUR63088.1 succinate--CoA ligase subunit alpha [Candidatus Thermoplasmatota archaeon]